MIERLQIAVDTERCHYNNNNSIDSYTTLFQRKIFVSQTYYPWSLNHIFISTLSQLQGEYTAGAAKYVAHEAKALHFIRRTKH